MRYTQDDRTMVLALMQGGYQQFTRYYFDWEPMKNQWLEHYAPQPNVVALGGIGSGKTSGKAMSFLTKAMTQPDYRGLNTSISSFQANLMFNMLCPLLEAPLVERFIKEVRSKPYPRITTHLGSYLAFMTVGYQAQGIRGSEWDEINFDEGGYESAEETIVALRGRLRGTRLTGIPRLARLTITTTPTDVPWLRVRWERGIKDSSIETYDGRSYVSLRSTLWDNHHIPDWQKAEIVKDLPEEMVKQEVEALFPDWGESEFAEAHISACENHWLNAYMEQLANPLTIDESGNERSGKPAEGAVMIEVPRLGVTRWELPCEKNHIYILASDPGTSSPPKRNSPVNLVWDVTKKPYRLVYFHWVSGNGSYLPWLSSFKWAMEKYKPLIKGIDNTGTQKALDELVLEREGIPMDSVSFAKDKEGMLNALKLLIQNHDVEFPFIKGMRSQLRSYKIKDDKIAQDIVATMMVFAHLERFVPTAKPVIEVKQASYDTRARSDRKRAAKIRRARR